MQPIRTEPCGAAFLLLSSSSTPSQCETAQNSQLISLSFGFAQLLGCAPTPSLLLSPFLFLILAFSVAMISLKNLLVLQAFLQFLPHFYCVQNFVINFGSSVGKARSQLELVW